MNGEDYRNYCLLKVGVTESFPFDQTTLVFKVGGKMFALTDIDEFDFVNLKSTPERCIELRETYQGISPGWHMNKVHWNSVSINSDVPDDTIKKLIDDSYELVYSSLPQRIKNELQAR